MLLLVVPGLGGSWGEVGTPPPEDWVTFQTSGVQQFGGAGSLDSMKLRLSRSGYGGFISRGSGKQVQGGFIRWDTLVSFLVPIPIQPWDQSCSDSLDMTPAQLPVA